MADTTYDLVVIGSGPGGYVAAIRAAQLGMNTACVEKYPALGGTCLNVGCIPSKALLDSSEHYAFLKSDAAAHGIRATVELDLAAMMRRKDAVVRELTRGIEGLFRKNKVARIVGTGRIAGPGVVEVTGEAGKQTLATERILIATGSKPVALPGVAFDGRRIVHSTGALSLPEVPQRLVVVGAGAIGLELGSVWLRLGSEVRVLELLERALPGMDAKSAATLQRALEKQGMSFTFGAAVRGARVEGDRVRVELSAGGATQEEACDVLLVAVGRRPFTEGLGAREAGVRMDERGHVLVDDTYRTSVPGIWAIGDVIPGPMLAHRAEEEGVAAVERMAGLAGHVRYDCIPGVVYTWPELAGVGLSEEQAKERGLAVAVGTFPFLANGRARAMGEREGQVKILADAATDRIVGAHIVGPRASDLIAELAVAMELGASAEDVARSVHAHPTLPEAVKEAALAVGKRAIHI
ncbi:MAG: dihydrolipoyl dehydrogenase [Candidatus Eisenbacteria bacterium]|nr:dihydrolipoyl dehydrogenase [Candidatus Eisenbacteria bacterium]